MLPQHLAGIVFGKCYIHNILLILCLFIFHISSIYFDFPLCFYHFILPWSSVLFVLFETTYFQFQGRFYEQLHGAAMGSPISPIVANLYMKDLRPRPLAQLYTLLVHGRGLWMIPLLSLYHQGKKSSWITLTTWTPTSNLQLRMPK